MSFTNQTLGALGTVSGALAASEHLKQQSAQIKETKELKEQQADQFKKQQDLQKAELVQTIDSNQATLDDQDTYVESELQRRDSYVNDEFLFGNLSTDQKLKELEAYAAGDVVHAKKGVELERARQALETVQGKIEARRQLQFDINMAKKKLKTIVRS